tara:strand:+ start:117 stop:386 length:270 start_codon:yes stop_codon:yes gene_type:complete
MTKTSKKALATKAKYNKKPSVQKKRVVNNKARRQALRDGRATKGDGTHVDHKVPLDKGGSTAKSNTRIVSAKVNKGWRKTHPSMYTKKG